MMKCFLFLNILAFAVIGGDWFGFYRIQAQTVRTIIVSEQDDGRKIHIKKGDVLVLKLKAQFGTGYRWQVGVKNKTRLRLVGESVEDAGKADESGFETQIFRFKAAKTGQSRLKFNYLRVWEKEVEPLKKIHLMIQIGKL